MPTTEMKVLPPYMEKDSQGPALRILREFLFRYAYLSVRHDPNGERYDDDIVEAVKKLQKEGKLDIDGGFGPETRTYVNEEFGFDFEAACREAGGMTQFVQPDGSSITWARDMPAD